MLLIFGGLPAAGKTAIATELARGIGAVHLRIDSIEQALRNSGVEISGPEGYVVAYAVAEDNLRLGRTLIADSVNPVEVTRAAWRNVAQRAGTRCVEIEIVCSDHAEHRRRVETRKADIAGHRLPTWRQVCDRKYEPWDANVVVDTAGQQVEASVAALRERLEGRA
ncbi:MAG: AAA family ATPase [Chloroflexi bacterium]|nr:AAA family ATPase [Chloroflexota bacterium]